MLSAAWVIGVALALQQPPATTGSAAAKPDRPITQFVQNLRRDAKSLQNWRTFEVLGAGMLGTKLAQRADDPLVAWTGRVGPALSYTPIGAALGNEWVQGGAAIAAYTIGVVQDSPEIAHIGSDLIRAQVLNGVVTVGLKVGVGRTRPNGGTLSFPSGHSSATFASATVLAEHYGWKVGIPAYAFAAFTGWTRVRDEQHWLSDVVFGSAMGIIAGHAVTIGHGRHSWSVVPAAAPGGGAVYLVKNR